MGEPREFDLNIEKILENWQVHHAIREIIANALDEQILTGTADIQIDETDFNVWHIRDFGRGLSYHHLTQNENQEKLENDHLIGRFGVGLKDALATLYRHDVRVTIRSKFGTITLKQSEKAGFDDITTLHAEIWPPEDPDMVGTDFELVGVDERDIRRAKHFFLAFSGTEVLETTAYGSVLRRPENSDSASIFINGVRVAQEENFLFSYNITSLTKALKNALNRERTNVGRTAYTERVKAILLECKSEQVIRSLTDDLGRFSKGTQRDELRWTDIQMHAAKQLALLDESVTFVSEFDYNTPSLVDEIRRSGRTPVFVPTKIVDVMDIQNRRNEGGFKFETTQKFLVDQKENFVPEVVSEDKLTRWERYIFRFTDNIFDLIGGKPSSVKEVLIVKKLYKNSDDDFYGSVVGLWQKDENRILILRDQLKSLGSYAETLLHEAAHASSGADDVDRKFELKLSEFLGLVAAKALAYSKPKD